MTAIFILEQKELSPFEVYMEEIVWMDFTVVALFE